MSTPIERLAARWRRTPRVAIPQDAARRAVEHDATHAGGGYVIVERLSAPIPTNLHGVVQDESVATDVLGFTDQEALNSYLAGLVSQPATITVQEGDATVDAAASVLDFDASDFNVTSSPSGEANVALNYGTGAGQPAEGNHTHAGGVAALDDLSDVTLTSPATSEVLTYNGSAWVNQAAAGGGNSPEYAFATPPTSGWSWVNQGGATVASDAYGELLTWPNSGVNNWRLRVRSITHSSAYSVTARLDTVWSRITSGSIYSGLVLRDSASGKFVALGLFANGSSEVIVPLYS